ncbi:MAG: hypothetical protein GC181_12165 [Bacteroidetes bacterium]|nr:hypothetical protein [Bacteroidota bacterium]
MTLPGCELGLLYSISENNSFKLAMGYRNSGPRTWKQSPEIAYIFWPNPSTQHVRTDYSENYSDLIGFYLHRFNKSSAFRLYGEAGMGLCGNWGSGTKTYGDNSEKDFRYKSVALALSIGFRQEINITHGISFFVTERGTWYSEPIGDLQLCALAGINYKFRNNKLN